MVASIIIVMALILFTGDTISTKNGFNRTFINQIIRPVYYSPKLNGLRSVCGIQNDHIYFETDTAGSIIETDSVLSNFRLMQFAIPGKEIVQTLYTTFIDSTNCYVMAGNVPAVIKVNLHSRTTSIFRVPGNLYSESVVLDSNNYIFRYYKKFSGKWNQIFVKANTLTNTVYEELNISERKGDAGFSTDGNLLFDESTRRVVYVEYYRNRFTCMDTSLQLLYRANTIDTFKNATVTVSVNESGEVESITNGSPLHEINLESRAAGGKLYIHSAVKADNEKTENFIHHSLIDVYQISDGQYLGSFYIPEYKGERSKEFEIDRDNIIVLYNNYVVIFSNPSQM